MSNESKKTLQEWIFELNAVDIELEHSANRILENCDALVKYPDISSDVQKNVTAIIESCSFHDLNSQRLRRIIKGLGQCMQDPGMGFRISELASSTASGPQRPGIALTQVDIENLMKEP